MTASDRAQWAERLWYGRSPWAWLFRPASGLYGMLTALRRTCYRRGLLRPRGAGVPVVVVGNITVGGTGKTPVAVWLAGELARRGFRPAIVGRGYGGAVGPHPLRVTAASDPAVAGDEAVLAAENCECPVFVHPDRVAAARAAAAEGADVVIADDGLQHYRLARDYEIAVIDAARGVGNGFLLPAGPLREPVSRLQTVDRILVQADGSRRDLPFLRRADDREARAFRLLPARLQSLDRRPGPALEELAGSTVHAVAAIGHPERFFRTLEDAGLTVIRHAYPDHATFRAEQLEFADELPVIMTEKDAVKCRPFARAARWFLPVTVHFPDGGEWLDSLAERLGRKAAIAGTGP